MASTHLKKLGQGQWRGKGGAAGAAAPLVIASAPPGGGLWINLILYLKT